MNEQIKDLLQNPYDNYIYAYPHKKAYREFQKPMSLKELWGKSEKNNLTLYIHIPFCMNKCGYCNLLSSVSYDDEKLKRYVNKLIEEIEALGRILEIENSNQIFSSVIFGGGTPTLLNESDLRRLLEAIIKNLKIDFNKTFLSMESSPRTLTKSMLELLKEYKVDRISIGVQSFHENELKGIFRLEPVEEIDRALQLMFSNNIPIRNIDLIYGLKEQTMDTWEKSLREALTYNPEEIFIYPMYIREKTGLFSSFQRDEDLMIKMYKFALDLLRDKGYIQTSMRNFIRGDKKRELFPEYSCQENNMVGVGCGARGYVDNIHYSRPYAVMQKNINAIINDYIQEDNFEYAKYGYILNEDEQKRRYILKSILKITGLNIKDYENKYKKSPLDEFKELNSLISEKFLINENDRIYPTDKGLMYSDIIGNLFISEDVNTKVIDFTE
ncbi:STM4012 family radical SAM protein [Oceanirhabdus sp. W0125-5]|uniref:STM4012 family radical SAM protein n=1 Tax=Oceanirhabdus sp. W0125-5 TaxID=2999116 RepID=UPI0022F332BA|nr:STM4012 family radical SAM protein [Oceanirhabdus sp. W0125-5]WBW98355.1 STM4012 family radical SAM protein [Oceanirhabdus sp. W0125-5]